MAGLHGYEGVPNIVVIGVPDQAGILRAAGICSQHQIPHFIWDEPDFEYGITALVTAAVRGEKREAFAEYELWKQFVHPSPNCKAADSKSVYAGAGPAG